MNEQTKQFDVLVIGGGASGMMAAIAAAQQGAKVAILEKNKRLGEKLRITGGGRCNITNAEDDVRVLLKNYGKADKYLFSAFASFGVSKTMQFFEELKLPLKVEAKKRVFPASDSAADVVHVLTNKMHRLGVELVTSCTVIDIEQAHGAIKSVATSNGTFIAKKYIVATGGLSRPETGSTGDGFTWLTKLGHSVRTPTPNITPLAITDDWVKAIAGVSAKNIALSFEVSGKIIFKVRGDVVFTHFGVSGPVILNNAYRVSDMLQEGPVTMQVDFMPDLQLADVDLMIQNVLNLNGVKLLKNTLQQFMPPGLAPALKMYLQNKVDFDSKNSVVNKNQRLLVSGAIKKMPAAVEGLMGFEKAVVADGGVDLNEINTRTMQSNKFNNLYITGDLLDINRPSGGYSLQLCWTTGYIAGTHAASKVN